MSSPPIILAMNLREAQIRERLGIPTEAESVLIFGETSHWDPNWLYTTEEYFDRRIALVIDSAIREVTAEPRRIFSIESVYFLQLYWDRRPEQREALRRLINEGRIRLTGSGITTPDTVLPATEALLRDYLLGQQWLREHKMTPEPRVAYLPDDFGYSPALPSVLAALGYDQACLTRIDGMYFVGCDYRPKWSFPLPGSSAELLQKERKTLDFVWRAPDDAEVLCHWNAFTYFQGDMLAYAGVIRWMGKLYGFSARSERHVARRIRGYVRQLKPLALTPYLFCPIGMDFNDPIPDLIELLDRYNETRFGDTGVWAVNAGLDDYLDLVACHRDKLPVLRLDPNPYWMGFYASRQEAKLRCNRIERKLVLAEKLSAVEEATAPPQASQQEGAEQPLSKRLEHAWDLLVLSNHHDFITGTSPDRVWEAEQQPWLRRAERIVDDALDAVSPLVLGSSDRADPPSWKLQDGRLRVRNPYYTVELSERRGGCIISFKDARDGRELLAGPANDLVAHHDSGGLWRMGHEYVGGTFREQVRASEMTATLTAELKGELLEVCVRSELCGRSFARWMWFRGDSPVVRMRLVGAAARRRTITCRFPTTFRSSKLAMDVPGGVVSRPTQKLYRPTFWPARSWLHFRDDRTDRGLAAFLGGPATPSVCDEGVVQWMAFRNAPKEMAFGFLPVLAHPARGTDPHDGAFDYAVWFTRTGDWRYNQLPRRVRKSLRAAMFPPEAPDIDEVANEVVQTDARDVFVTAVKVASRGEGIVARLRSVASSPLEVRLRCTRRAIRAGWLCDARERDQGELVVDRDEVVVPVKRSITSVRMVF